MSVGLGGRNDVQNLEERVRPAVHLKRLDDGVGNAVGQTRGDLWVA